MSEARIETLNCPNCGAAVSSGRTKCEFCRSRLKTVACPSCFGMMFLGSKHCAHCGTKAVGVETREAGEGGKCPRCRIDLNSIAIADTAARECDRCGGFWTSADTFESLCASREQQAAVLSFIRSHPHEAATSPIKYVPCPVCGNLMNRSNFARSSGIIIDLCKQHGVWFDADELPKIIEFINGGGMERAREKEKIAIADERAKLRDEKRRMTLLERRSGGGRIYNEEKESGFGRAIRALFDI